MIFFEREEWEKWSPGCNCAEDLGAVAMKIVAYTITGGQKRYGLRCDVCQRLNGGKPIALTSLTLAERTEADKAVINLAEERDNAARVDDYKRAKWREDKEAENEAERERWWEAYDTYLFSPEWRTRRAAVLKRDNYECQACCIARATEVHHTTYRHLFHEPLFELVSVCRPCHEAITEIDRRGIPKEYRERIG